MGLPMLTYDIMGEKLGFLWFYFPANCNFLSKIIVYNEHFLSDWLSLHLGLSTVTEMLFMCDFYMSDG